jgi:hypothetical protein
VASVKIILKIVLVPDWAALYKTPNKQYLVGSDTGGTSLGGRYADLDVW